MQEQRLFPPGQIADATVLFRCYQEDWTHSRFKKKTGAARTPVLSSIFRPNQAFGQSRISTKCPAIAAAAAMAGETRWVRPLKP